MKKNPSDEPDRTSASDDSTIPVRSSLPAVSTIGALSILSALLLLPLGACSVGDAWTPPKVSAPQAWPAGGTGAAEWPSADWWSAFQSPELDLLMKKAMDGNLDVAQAAARVRQADAQARISGAALLPSLDLGASATRQQTPAPNSSGSSDSSGSSGSSGGKAAAAPEPSIANSFQTKLTASWEIDFWGKNAAAAESAEAAAQVGRFDRIAVGLTAQAAVADAYVAVVGARERLRIAEGNLRAGEEILSAVSDRKRAGTAGEVDLAAQESQTAALAAAVPPLRQALAQNQDVLALLIGEGPGGAKTVGADLGALRVPEIVEGLPSGLLLRRPDVRMAEEQLRAANADVAVARAQALPSVTLTLADGLQSAALGGFAGPANVLWSLAGSLSAPIFHGGALEGGKKLKEGRREELVFAYLKASLSAFSDADQALAAAHEGLSLVRAQERLVAAAERSLALSQDQMRAGVVDITALLSAQKTLFSARDALAQARSARLQAAVGLFKALGGGWSGREVPAAHLGAYDKAAFPWGKAP